MEYVVVDWNCEANAPWFFIPIDGIVLLFFFWYQIFEAFFQFGSCCVFHVGVLELLLTRKADKEATDQDHLTPAAHAVIRGQTRTLDLLIKAEANIHTKDKNQRTLLHHAAVVKNNVKLVEMLMESGLDIEAMDKDGIRAIDMAIGHGNEVMVASLLRKGAKLGPTTWAMAKGKPRIA